MSITQDTLIEPFEVPPTKPDQPTELCPEYIASMGNLEERN